jgi:threonine/homoserine/homoserine lactone efflux protein
MAPFERFKTSPGFHLAMAIVCSINVVLVATVTYFSISLRRYAFAVIWMLVCLVVAWLARELFRQSRALANQAKEERAGLPHRVIRKLGDRPKEL